MSTPTPSNPAQPNSASKKPTGHVTTPSHLGLSSPAPRSVPSPAATRKDQAGKTPTNHPTASSSKTLGGTPMMPTLSQTGMNSSSPGTHNASFGTPSVLAGLGMDLGSGTPGQMNIATPAGGTSMMPSLSDLGMGLPKRNEDEERRAKMRKVLKSIGKCKGRVSEEGIARISRRVGFENTIDGEGILSAEEKERAKVGNRDFAIAGNHVMIDMLMENHVVKKAYVVVQDVLEEHQKAASKVLLQDLTPPDGVLLRSTLDRFATNLDSLARLDRLSKEVNCFEALSKLHKSLGRLYELEKKEALESSKDEKRAETEVLCKRSGKPVMHENRRIGLALEHWTTGPSTTKDSRDESKMDVDGENKAGTETESSAVVYALHIEVEESPAALYPALRVSDEWLPETFELSGSDAVQSIPWQDPSPTYISESAGNQPDAMVIDNGSRLPDLRFVAKFDPPIIVPGSTASQILASVGAQEHPYFANYYHLMVLNKPVNLQNLEIETTRSVLCLNQGKEEEVQHKYTLDVSKPDLGYKLEALPFSHPRQLVELLPILRQWASFGDLVRNTFGDSPTEHEVSSAANGVNGANANGINKSNGSTKPLDDFLDSNGFDSPSEQALLVNVGLSTHPQAALSFNYTDVGTEAVRSATVQVSPNADIIVTDFAGEQEDRSDDVHGLQPEQAKKLARALSVCGDTGVWIEWMRRSKQ